MSGWKRALDRHMIEGDAIGIYSFQEKSISLYRHLGEVVAQIELRTRIVTREFRTEVATSPARDDLLHAIHRVGTFVVMVIAAKDKLHSIFAGDRQQDGLQVEPVINVVPISILEAMVA